MTIASTCSWLNLTTSLAILLLLIELAAILALAASVTALAAGAELVDLFVTGGTVHFFALFFLKYMCPLCLRGDVNDKTLRASLAKPCARRTARRNARGLVTRILRLRTIFPCLLRWKPFMAPPCIPIRLRAAPPSPAAAAPPAAEITGCLRIVPPAFRAMVLRRPPAITTGLMSEPPGAMPSSEPPRALITEKNPGSPI